MNENPIHPPKEEVFYYPFCVCYVYLNPLDKFHPTFKAVKEFCDSQCVPIYCRLYDERKYIEDREDIESLPAFHMYTDGLKYPQETFYISSRAIEKVNAYIVRWELELVRAQERQQRRNERKKNVVSFLKNLFVKKTHMGKIADKMITSHEAPRPPQDGHYR